MKRDSALRRERPAAHRIPYSLLVAPEVLCTGDGAYVQVLKLDGASFESADDEVLNNWHERLNVLLRNIASPQVALWTHLVRRRERTVPLGGRGGVFAERLAAKYRSRLATETLMVNEIYLSAVYRPVTGVASSWASRLLRRSSTDGLSVQRADALDGCEKLRQTLLSSLARYEPEVMGLYVRVGRRYSRLLEFLGVLVNGEHQSMALPRAPVNEVLATSRVIFGTEAIEYRTPTHTRLGAVLGIKEYPSTSIVGMYDGLLSAPFPFVLTQSFSFLTKAVGQGLLQRQYNQMVNAGDFAVSQAEELKDALDDLSGNTFVVGDHHFTLQVLTELEMAGSNPEKQVRRLNDDVGLARSMLADTGMTVAREDLALEAAYWAQLPGCFALRPRKAPITSRNFAAMFGAHNYPTGRATGNHWGDALAMLITSARSPFYFSLHASDPKDPDGGSRKDTGHTFLCGPSGSGKTVLIGFLITLLARQGVSQVIFDKDKGLEILVRALNGVYLPLRNGERTGFNPLRLEPTPDNIEFLKVWLRTLVRKAESSGLSARDEADLDQALRGTLGLAPEARRLSRLIEFLDATHPEGCYARLSRWCESTGGDYAWVFDAREDSVVAQLAAGHPIVGFDVTDFLDHAVTRVPITLYLFHLVRQLITGRPLVCWMEEFSRQLNDAAFQQFGDNGLLVWRKLNAVFCGITQTAHSVLKSPISRTIIEQTATKIYFPNPDASADDYIDGFNLTEREFKLIKEQLEPGSRMFLVKQGHHSVVCELDLKGFDAELKVVSGRAHTVEEVRRLIAEVGPDPDRWLPIFLEKESSPC